VEVITGPAGTGKTRVLAGAAHAWGGPVTGTATSQNATNELRRAGVQVAANTTQLLATLDRIRPGSLIVVDEGSMVSVAHLAALVDHAARAGCKLVLAGDQEQLAAVEGGGAMTLLAGRLGYVQLASRSGSLPPGNATPPCGCATATPPPWTTMTSTAASTAPRPMRRWTRPPRPTSPATSRAGM
jgi:AAA domain-containing protein